MAVASSQYSLEAFLRLPEEKPALEFADGKVTRKVSPRGHHSRLQVELVKRLDAAGMAQKLALSFSELRVTFDETSCLPDIAVYRWGRILTDPAGRIANNFTVPPNLTIEIVSPEQSINALMRRCIWFVGHGVELALLVDPVDESIAAFRANTLPLFWRGSDRIDLGDIVPTFQLTVEELFATLQIR